MAAHRERPDEPGAGGTASSSERSHGMARRALAMVRDWGLTLVFGAVVFHGFGQLRAPDLPSAAPDFTLPALDGESVQLSSLQGRTVVLNFWATWCGPCRLEVPQLSSFADANPDVIVLGLATDGTAGELRTAREALGIRYRVLRADSATVQAYGAETLPTTVVVGPDGSIEAAHTGIITRPQLALLLP
ncbi:MAG: TlpA disulfide reductase family protein [Myxococcota bacterium]|nr:TlpA disulfide reductase family protein [Myxococcota bacterium]MEC8424097.1 TlpA disulfide reductase family protein [Myxococcota bacterium]